MFFREYFSFGLLCFVSSSSSFFVIFTMHDLLHYEKALGQRHQNGSSTCEQMDKRLDDTVKKRDVDKGLGLATNLCPAALWVATQI